MSQAASIVYVVIDLHIPMAHSLKEKRKHIKSLKDKLQAGFNASVAEIDHLDEWQRAVMGVVMISNDQRYLQGEISRIETLLREYRDIQVVNIEQQWL